MTRIATLDYPGKEIRMLVTTEVEQKYRVSACAKEPWTTAWIESFQPGSVFYDVGANVGSYTLLAAALGHTVIAIEPAFANFARLCENVLLNNLEGQVIPLCIALGRQGGSTPVMECEPSPGWSGGTRRLRVPMLTLVDLPFLFGVPMPTHVKIDVDTGEADVLAGSSTQAQSFMVEIAVKRNGTNGLYPRDRLEADPLACTAPDSLTAVHWLTAKGYTLRQTFAGTGSTPVVWYGLWAR